MLVHVPKPGAKGWLTHTSWPGTTLRNGHVLKICNEQAILVRFFALKSNAWPSFIQTILVTRIGSQLHSFTEGINRV